VTRGILTMRRTALPFSMAMAGCPERSAPVDARVRTVVRGAPSRSCRPPVCRIAYGSGTSRCT